MDSALVLIAPPVAATYSESLQAEEAQRLKRAARTTETGAPRPPSEVRENAVGADVAAPNQRPAGKQQFYGTVELDPVKAKFSFAEIVDEVVQQFTARHDIKVSISIEIRAESPTAFEEALQRVVRENCRVLKFKNGEFE